MKYYLLLIFAFIAFTCNAATNKADTDTIISKLDYKQSKQYFLENYGKDDSTKALINYFFRKRKTAFYQTVIPPTIGLGLSILLARAVNTSNNTVGGKGGYGGLVFGLAFVYVALNTSALLIEGQIKWLVFSRHKLLKLLVDYDSGKSLPKKIRRRNQFKQELEKLKTKI